MYDDVTLGGPEAMEKVLTAFYQAVDSMYDDVTLCMMM
jgi:hypothetical protein